MRARFAIVVVALMAAGLPARGTTPPPETLATYFAGMHNHTGYSDGVPETTPADAYAKARTNGLDVMTVTEHSESYPIPNTFSEQCLDPQIARCALADGTNSFRKWDATLEQARAATDADFLGVRGFEWTSDVEDHINVYLSANYTNAKIDGGYATMNTFWDWALKNRDALITFNHPGDKTNVNTGGAKIAPGPYDDFRHVPQMDRRVVGIEVFNGGKGKDYTNRGGVNWIARALNTGWHVGLIGSQDTHTNDWGDPAKYARTGFLMPSVNEKNFRTALLRRHFYATTDANLELSFGTDDGDLMGARIRKAAGESVTLTANATDPDGEATTKIELFTNGTARDEWTKVTEVAGGSLAHAVTSAWGERWYLVRVTQADGEKAYSSPIWLGANSHPYGEWLAGDLHVHTQNGHDTCMGADPTMKFDGTACDEPWTWSFSPAERIELAKFRGLDYLAITDHQNVVSQSDPAYKAQVAAQQAGTSSFLLIPAYENSLAGHAQMLGATHCFAGVTFETGTPIQIPYCGKPGHAVSAMQAHMAELRAEGGVFQVNHPSDRDWTDRFDKDSNGNAINDLFELVPDTVEVWNIGTWAWQPPAPASNDNDFSVSFWERYLNAGYHVAATGGSDSHWRLTSERQGVGQPTTWVWASPEGYANVLQGIRDGATTISWDPPLYHAPRIFLEGDADGNGTFESMPGDTMPMTDSTRRSWVRVRVENAPPGAMVRIIEHGDGYEGDNVRLYALDEIAKGAFASPFRWLRAELVMPGSDAQTQLLRTSACNAANVPTGLAHCRNRLVVLAMTSAIFQAPA